MRALKSWASWLVSGRRADKFVATPSNVNTFRRVFIDLASDGPGFENSGVKDVTFEAVRHLCEIASDWEFILLTSEESEEGLQAWDFEKVRRISTGRSILSGRSLPRELKADLVFCPGTLPNFYKPAIPVVSFVHDLQHVQQPHFFQPVEIQERDRNFRRVCGMASRIVCVSQYVRDTVLEAVTLPERIVETIPMVPRHLIQSLVPARDRLLRSLQLNPEGFLYYPASFLPHKNHELLLTAFGMYRSANPASTLKLVLAGAGSRRRDELIAATRNMNLTQAVVFPGSSSNEDMGVLMESCSAVIFPSLFEGSAMPVLDAIAAGKPVLSSNATSLPETAGDAACYFDPRKPSELVDAISQLQGSPEFRTRLTEQSLLRRAALGGPEAMVARYLNVFQDAVTERGNFRRGRFKTRAATRPGSAHEA